MKKIIAIILFSIIIFTSKPSESCTISVPIYSITHIPIIPIAGVNIPDQTVTINCASNTNYSLSLLGLLTNGGKDIFNGTKKVRLHFYRDAARTSQITGSSNIVVNGTGSGTNQTINVFLKLVPLAGSCTLQGSNFICPTGLYSGTLNYRVTF